MTALPHVPRLFRAIVLAACLAAALSACAPRAPVVAPVPPPPMSLQISERGAMAPVPAVAVGLRAGLTDTLDALVREALADSASPGAALAVGRFGRLVHLRGYGRTDWEEGSPPVTEHTLYDLASLTKVVATTTAAMILEEEGLLSLQVPVSAYLPDFTAREKADITPYELLTHTSGMTTRMLYEVAHGRKEYLRKINDYPLASAPGTEMLYSDWNMIVMQLIVESLSARPLDEFLRERVWKPLGMEDTMFRPDSSIWDRVAPTEVVPFRGGQVHGVVHDENAWAMGGVAGHAGLFSSARDLAVFSQMLLNGGSFGDVRILQPETVARWTARQGPLASRALGWDTPSGVSSSGNYFSAWSWGHTGFTGTSIWMDPRDNLFLILLTNRVNPTRENTRVYPLRRALGDAVQRAVLPPAYGE